MHNESLWSLKVCRFVGKVFSLFDLMMVFDDKSKLLFHPVGTKCHGNPSDSCHDVSVIKNVNLLVALKTKLKHHQRH